uniref:Uncharacterized protein n=1 Tax=Leersia perrieri TaxID=77586 RepID=A0A0D9XF02_9ORYZ
MMEANSSILVPSLKFSDIVSM